MVMHNIFVYKLKDNKYVPYFKGINAYNRIDINHAIKLLCNKSNIYTSNKISNRYIRKSLNMLDRYKGCDILIIWTDIDIYNNIQSIRGFVSIYEKIDNIHNKYYYIDILCNASKCNVKRRNNNIRINGSYILKYIDKLCINNGIKYIKLRSLEDVILYYNKYDYKLVNYPYKDENNKTKQYILTLKQLRNMHNNKMYIKIMNYMNRFISIHDGYIMYKVIKKRL